MAESKSVTVIPLNGSNYPTWKIQCRMALTKDGLWNIVKGTETAPAPDADGSAKFAVRKDRALATLVLTIEPSLLYLVGDPQDPAEVWKKLADQFEKRTWANKLSLRRRLHSLRLQDGDSVQEHIKALTEIFDSLSIVGDAVPEEDRVVHLLASLPDSYDVLVTALEAHETVPKMEVVTERLLHTERKFKERAESGAGQEEALNASLRGKKKWLRCHHCGKRGHLKRNCRKLEAEKEQKSSQQQHAANKSATKGDNDSSSSESEGAGVVIHALSASESEQRDAWIIDSGATCHMCHNKELFIKLETLKQPLEVILGDGRARSATAKGNVVLNMLLPNGKTTRCELQEVLYVPKLSLNLLSISKATQKGKVAKFTKTACYVLDRQHTLLAQAIKRGQLYYLRYQPLHEEANSSIDSNCSNEDIWHRRFGHLGVRYLQKLAKDSLVKGFKFDVSKELSFCQDCTEGKQCRNKFPISNGGRADEPLDLVHSDLCGKMSTPSLSGSGYFLTFIDDNTHYVWVYVLKTKDQVFERFLEWKAMVERSTGRKLKCLRTDNGGEYTSREFESYLRVEGIRHERSVPKNPEQNGVAERMNRTLMEAVRSMLSGAGLPQRFWAEALATAAYLRNRSPTKALEKKTPYEAWTGEKPVVDHLRAFGCQAFAHIPKDERKKLDAKSRRCILLGYGNETKGYRLYDQQKGKMFLSRDVEFNERKCGFEKEQSESNSLEPVEVGTSGDDENPTNDSHDTTPSPEVLPLLRRSEREKRAPVYYGMSSRVTTIEPLTVNEALSSPDKEKWLGAMKNEMESLSTSEVWDLVELPKGRNAVGCKWVFKTKVNEDGSLNRFKARLVAQGFSQKHGLDYDQTFSPVVRPESVRTLLALATQKHLKLHQMDVTTAFLNGELHEEIYMKQPEGFVTEGREKLVCKLKRSLYGLKQSPRCWNQTLDSELKKMGFVQSTGDPCVYTTFNDGLLILAVYVDDIILAGESEKAIERVKALLARRFKLKDMGELSFFLGVSVKQTPTNNKIWIGQPSYTQNILQKFEMQNAKPTKTPVDVSLKLIKATEECDTIDSDLYQSAVGSLLYLSSWSRPDITFAVSNVARFCARPTQQHWIAVKRIMRYLQGTKAYGLLYSSDTESCFGYSDADWAGDVNDRKSTSGYLFKLGGAAITWRSKKQTCVALSTAEAEYAALTSAAQEATWLRQLSKDLLDESSKPTIIYEDNQSAISIANNPQFHGRMKHIEIKYHFIREKILTDTIQLIYCPTTDMVADMLTKGLSHDKFSKLRDLAGITDISVCK